MTAFFTVGVPDVRATRINPVAKVVALVILSLPVLVTGQSLIAIVLIAGEVLALPWLGLGPRTLVRYTWPFVLGLTGIWLTNYLASGDLSAVLPVTVRLFSLALPGLVFVLTTEPVALADALVQIWRVPPRFAYGALAALRLLPLLGEDWTSMRRARRARGLSAGVNPVRRLRSGFEQLFSLLVSAIRRGIRLATAMDARGFGVATRRSFSRESRLQDTDVAVMVAAALLAIAAVITGILA